MKIKSSMRRTRSSVTQVPSLRPELEFEIIKLVLLRESYVEKLKRKVLVSKSSPSGDVVGLVDTLRDSSVEIVDTIKTWERTQARYLRIVVILTMFNSSNADKLP